MQKSVFDMIWKQIAKMGTKVFTLLIVAMLLLSMSLTVFNAPVLAAPAPSVWLETTTTTFGPSAIGTVFEVKIMINVTGYNLNTIDINIKWNPSVFHILSSYTKGTFMPGSTMWMDPVMSNSTGTADGLAGAIPSSGTVTGSGWLVSYDFVIVGFNSSTVIDLYKVSALDPGMDYIIGPNADMPGDLTITVSPIETISHIVTVDAVDYVLVTASNSSVSPIQFNTPEINFTVTGPTDTTGFVNITIPKTFMKAETPGVWIVLVDSTPLTYTETQNTTHTNLYFTFNQTTQTIRIQGTWVIPEFPTVSPILILMIITLTLILTIKTLTKHCKTKPNKNQKREMRR